MWNGSGSYESIRKMYATLAPNGKPRPVLDLEAHYEATHHWFSYKEKLWTPMISEAGLGRGFVQSMMRGPDVRAYSLRCLQEPVVMHMAATPFGKCTTGTLRVILHSRCPYVCLWSQSYITLTSRRQPPTPTGFWISTCQAHITYRFCRRSSFLSLGSSHVAQIRHPFSQRETSPRRTVRTSSTT